MERGTIIMAEVNVKENEVKFKVTKFDLSELGGYAQQGLCESTIHMTQNYIFDTAAGTMRIRREKIMLGPVKYILNIKGRQLFKDGRVEVERELKTVEYFALLSMATNGIEKLRYNLKVDLSTGEKGILSVDLFTGSNNGLVIAELEYVGEVMPTIIDPPLWLGKIVDDPKLFNSALAVHPFSEWSEAEKSVYKW